MNRKIIIFNVFGHRNTGDAMLLEALVDDLRKQVPLERIEGIAFDIASERKWMPELQWHERIGTKTRAGIVGRLLQLAFLFVAIAIAISRLFLAMRYLLPEDQRRAIEALDGAELAISCPGGYLEDSNKAYLLNLLQMMLARRLAARTILAPQSIGPIRSDIGRSALSFALLRMDAIYVREKASIDFLRTITKIDMNRVHLSGDLAFWYTRRKNDALAQEWKKLGVNPSIPIIGMTVVEWAFPHHPHPDKAQQSYLNSLSELIRHIQKEGTHQVVLFNQVSTDLSVADRLVEITPGLIVDRFERDSGIFAAMIGQCELFVGSRFHSCIFGLLGSVPTIAIAYLPKSVGIMSELGLSDLTIQIDTITPNVLRDKFDNARKNHTEISNKISEAVSNYRKEQDLFFRDMRCLLNPERRN